MRMPAPSNRGDELLQGAKQLGSATLHEAANRKGALPHVLKPIDGDMRLAGWALPVRCPGGDNLWIHRALATTKAGDVLVIDAGMTAAFGYWGEVMATAALARGAAGIVLTGGVRDSRRLTDLGLPTFCASIAIQGTAKDPASDGAIGEPIRLGETIIRVGDLIVGDADGLVCIPKAHVKRTVAAGRRREAAETEILQRIRQGERTLDIYGLDPGVPGLQLARESS